MPQQEDTVALPLRSHTILGTCEAIGEDFGFNPVLMRIPFAAIVLWSPLIAIGAYLALGVVVLASRLLFPAATVAGEAKVPAEAMADNDSTRNDGMSIAA
jgi:phage shock protein PspC (stress-responsive transcriptional regulator)